MTVFDIDYARGYDALYKDKDYKAECDLVEEAIALYGKQPTARVLDVGCGTGGHAIELSHRGHAVTGIDISPHMLEAARQKTKFLQSVAHTPLFLEGDARTFTARDHGKFDVAVMMFAVLGYLGSNTNVLDALKNIRAHLAEGGIFVCDFWWGPAVLSQRPGERVRIVPTNYGKLLRGTRTDLDTLNNIAHVNFELFHLSDTEPASQTSETHRMRYFFKPELELFLQTAGFRLERLSQFMHLDQQPTDNSWNAMLVGTAI